MRRGTSTPSPSPSPLPARSLSRSPRSRAAVRHGRRHSSSLPPRFLAHGLPPPKWTAGPPSSHHAAPLDLLYRRLWPLMLPTVGAAAVAAAATVAAPPQATSGQAEQPSVCARDPWSSPATPPPPSTPTAGRSREPAAPLLCFPTRGFVLEFEKREGPFCRTCDSCE